MTQMEAMAYGVTSLRNMLEDALSVPQEQVVKAKAEKSTAIQWFPGIELPGVVKLCGEYFYRNKRIQLGDWIVDGNDLLTDFQFRERYDIVS